MMKDAKEDKVKEITDKLEAGIKELFESGRYQEYLNVMSKFHHYSFNNSLLIAMQCPEATMVAGYKAWQANFERSVNPGEKGIKIIAPAPHKIYKDVEKIDPKTKQPVLGKNGKPLMERVQVTIPAYKVVNVFDISQTSGKDLPEIAKPLEGDVNEYDKMLEAIKQISPVPVNICAVPNGCNGYYDLKDKVIAIREGMSQMQTIKTAIHELSHAKLHDRSLVNPKEKASDRNTKEVEAESIAYTVCQHYGLDTSDYSFGYVAGWSSDRELEELKKSMNTIQSTATAIIKGIDYNMLLMQKEEEKAYEISFYVAKHLNVQAEGEYYRVNTIQEAVDKYKELTKNTDSWNLEIGFRYCDKTDKLHRYEELPLINDNRLNTKVVNEIEKYKKCPEIQEAIKKIQKLLQPIKVYKKENTDYRHRGRGR